MWRNERELRKWLMREIWGPAAGGTPTASQIPRKPPARTMKPQSGPARNYKYRMWIRSSPCAICALEPAGEAAHTSPHHGLSQKASDYSTVPLCANCHTLAPYAYHRIGRKEFERRHGINIDELVERLNHCWWNQWKRVGGI